LTFKNAVIQYSSSDRTQPETVIIFKLRVYFVCHQA